MSRPLAVRSAKRAHIIAKQKRTIFENRSERSGFCFVGASSQKVRFFRFPKKHFFKTYRTFERKANKIKQFDKSIPVRFICLNGYNDILDNCCIRKILHIVLFVKPMVHRISDKYLVAR